MCLSLYSRMSSSWSSCYVGSSCGRPCGSRGGIDVSRERALQALDRLEESVDAQLLGIRELRKMVESMVSEYERTESLEPDGEETVGVVVSAVKVPDGSGAWP